MCYQKFKKYTCTIPKLQICLPIIWTWTWLYDALFRDLVISPKIFPSPIIFQLLSHPAALQLNFQIQSFPSNQHCCSFSAWFEFLSSQITETCHNWMAILVRQKWGIFGSCCCVFAIICSRICAAARSDKEIRERFYGNMLNSSSSESNDGSLAKMFDRVLEKEFSENDQPEGFHYFFLSKFSILLCFLISLVLSFFLFCLGGWL